MKPKKETRHSNLTDADRDTIMRLTACGLSSEEIADIMKCAPSSVRYIKQIYAACINQDWEVLHRLSVSWCSATAWAMSRTGLSWDDEPKSEPVVAEVTIDEPNNVDATHNIPLDDVVVSMSKTLVDIRNLLTEIRDLIK